MMYMQEVADIVADTPEPTNEAPLCDFQFPEPASNDPKLEVVREIHANLSSAIKWRRAHFRFRSVLAHLYAVRDPMAAGFVAGIVHRSILRQDESWTRMQTSSLLSPRVPLPMEVEAAQVQPQPI